MEIKYLCNLPFFEPNSQNQEFIKSKSSWLMLKKDKAIVYFQNNRTYKIDKDIEINLPDGKYRCTK